MKKFLLFYLFGLIIFTSHFSSAATPANLSTTIETDTPKQSVSAKDTLAQAKALAEYKKIEAEIQKLNAEARKNNADASKSTLEKRKAIFELLTNFKLIAAALAVTAGVTGTLPIISNLIKDFFSSSISNASAAVVDGIAKESVHIAIATASGTAAGITKGILEAPATTKASFIAGPAIYVLASTLMPNHYTNYLPGVKAIMFSTILCKMFWDTVIQPYMGK